jgi:hypothetical protein
MITYKLFVIILKVVGYMTSPIMAFLDSFSEELLIGIIVAILLAILGFIFKKKILIKLRMFVYWLFDTPMNLEAFVIYLAMEELTSQKFEQLFNNFAISLKNEGFYYNELTEKVPLSLKSVLLKKGDISFILDIIDIPANVDYSHYKMKFNLMGTKIKYRTGIEELRDMINKIISISDRSIGNLSGKPNFVITFSNKKHRNLNISHQGSLSITTSKNYTQVKDTDVINALKFSKIMYLS